MRRFRAQAATCPILAPSRAPPPQAPQARRRRPRRGARTRRAAGARRTKSPVKSHQIRRLNVVVFKRKNPSFKNSIWAFLSLVSFAGACRRAPALGNHYSSRTSNPIAAGRCCSPLATAGRRLPPARRRSRPGPSAQKGLNPVIAQSCAFSQRRFELCPGAG